MKLLQNYNNRARRFVICSRERRTLSMNVQLTQRHHKRTLRKVAPVIYIYTDVPEVCVAFIKTNIILYIIDITLSLISLHGQTSRKTNLVKRRLGIETYVLNFKTQLPFAWVQCIIEYRVIRIFHALRTKVLSRINRELARASIKSFLSRRINYRRADANPLYSERYGI